MEFSRAALEIDPQAECLRLVDFLRKNVHQILRRQGGVVGISGGVDSAVVLGLCVRAFSAEKVLALFLPEKESAPESKDLAFKVARHFGVEPRVEDITPALEGFNCYARRDRLFGASSRITTRRRVTRQKSSSPKGFCRSIR